MGSDGEFAQAGLELQNGVGDNQMTSGALPGGRLPCQQSQTKDELVLLAKPELFLVDTK
jgi:hypothetical protein